MSLFLTRILTCVERVPPSCRCAADATLFPQSAPTVVRFFRRSKEWIYYTCHGKDADLVGREAFKNTSAVSVQGGLPSLTVRLALGIAPSWHCQTSTM